MAEISNAELIIELRKRAEWYDHGHGYLHGLAADRLEQLLGLGDPAPKGEAAQPKEWPAEPEPIVAEHDVENEYSHEPDEVTAHPHKPKRRHR